MIRSQGKVVPLQNRYGVYHVKTVRKEIEKEANMR